MHKIAAQYSNSSRDIKLSRVHLRDLVILTKQSYINNTENNQKYNEISFNICRNVAIMIHKQTLDIFPKPTA